jgi:hypothetical protein
VLAALDDEFYEKVQAFLELPWKSDIQAALWDSVAQLRVQGERAWKLLGESTEQEAQAGQRALAEEKLEVDKSYDLHLRCLDALGSAVQARDQGGVETALEQLEDSVSRLNLAVLRWREVALSERGPTSHPGLNEIFDALHAEPPWEDVEWRALIDRELQREHGFEDGLAQLEEELQVFQERYRLCLSGLSQSSRWEDSLEPLGLHYLRLDLPFFARHYDQGPTPISWLNLAHQSCSLWSQGALSHSLAVAFLDRAIQQQETLPSHPDVDALSAELSGLLEELADRLECEDSNLQAQLQEIERIGHRLALACEDV